MLALRALPRWRVRRLVSIPRPSQYAIRRQHDQHKPTAQAIVSASPDPIAVLNARAHDPNAATPRPISYLRLLLRSIVYVAFFGLTGFAASWSWKTYNYLRTGHKINLPATQQKNRENFASHIEGSGLVKSLRRDGWVEDDLRVREARISNEANEKSYKVSGQHMVNDRLAGSGHLTTKQFRNPKDSTTVLVFMADKGCESWPDTLHGGIATTVIEEALNTHTKNFPDLTPIRERLTIMNYRLPLHPGVMYNVLVQTVFEEQSLLAGTTGVDGSSKAVAASVLVNALDRIPQYATSLDDSQQVERVKEYQKMHKGTISYVSGASMLFLATERNVKLFEKNEALQSELRKKRDDFVKMTSSIRKKPS